MTIPYNNHYTTLLLYPYFGAVGRNQHTKYTLILIAWAVIYSESQFKNNKRNAYGNQCYYRR